MPRGLDFANYLFSYDPNHEQFILVISISVFLVCLSLRTILSCCPIPHGKTETTDSCLISIAHCTAIFTLGSKLQFTNQDFFASQNSWQHVCRICNHAIT